MNDSALQRRFHRNADEARFYNRLDNPWLRERELAFARSLAALAPGSPTVLESGCGEGSNLYFLNRVLPGASLHGIDFSAAKVEFARRLLPFASFQTADALRLPYPDASFDLVFCRDLLHHVDFDRPGVLREMWRVAKPGAWLAIFEARGSCPLNRLFQLLYPAERGLKNSSAPSLEALGRELGEPEISFVSPTLVLPAAGFILGWPRSPVLRGLFAVAYGGAWALDRTLQRISPMSRWPYMLLTLQKAS